MQMTRLIIPALVALLVSGPAWGDVKGEYTAKTRPMRWGPLWLVVFNRVSKGRSKGGCSAFQSGMG